MALGNKPQHSAGRKFNIIQKLTDTSIALDRRITMILALSGAVGNTLGFLANLIIYGMTFPTVFCGVCALLILLNVFFGLKSVHYRAFGWAMLILLDVFEFPLLVFTYGPVMYPYLMLGFVGMLMLTTGRYRVVVNVLLGCYDVGVIILSSLHPYIFGAQDPVGLMGSAISTFVIALCAMTALMVAWQSVSVIETSDIDRMTGILTQTGFLRNAGEFLQYSPDSEIAVLVFNIKNFKVVNTVFGNSGGNRMLREVGQMLKSSDLHPLYTCRLNADHFVCLVEKEKIDYELLNELCELKHTENGKSISLTMHCGVYLDDGMERSIQSMTDKATLALRFVRGGQSRHYAVFDHASSAAYEQETQLLGELDAAIQEEVFIPYYQPIVDCKTKQIISAEALVRWVHPQRGVLSPGVFIPILEKKELISELDSIVLKKVSDLILRQEQAGDSIVPISVNLSRIDLYNNHLMEQIRQLVSGNTSLKLRHRFELTESVYESLPESTMRTLSELRKYGTQILIDDFGTGYSSLGMITDYEFDIIKLDMSFANKLEANEKVRGIVRSLIDMIHKMDAKVIMEGIENEKQFEIIREAGCDQVQGYFFYRPMPEDEFLELLRRQEKKA